MRKATTIGVSVCLAILLAIPAYAVSPGESMASSPLPETSADVDIAYLNPISPSNDPTPVICYYGNYWDYYVDFFWSNDSGSTWNFWDWDPDPGPLSGVYQIQIPLPEEGTYYFAVVADVEPTPETLADADYGPWTLMYLDPGEPPISHVNQISGNWAEGSPWQLSAVAIASGNVSTVELWWKSDANPTWSLYQTDSAAPWEWAVNFPIENINYYFYSIATDDLGLREAAPPIYDTWCWFAWSHYPAKATGPVGNSTSKSVTITYLPDCGCFGTTYLWYRRDGGPWTFISDEGEWGEDGYCNWIAPGSGVYWWAATNSEIEMNWPPGAAEAGPYNIQTGAPISIVNNVFPYWRNSSPATITANATAYGGATVSNVTLYYSFSSNNVSWGSWNAFGLDVAAPWQWSFSWPSGQGYYRFYSYAIDSLGRGEEYAGTVEARAGYDTTPPQHMVTVPIVKETTLNPCSITPTIGDSLSGLGSYTVYYSVGSSMGPFMFWGVVSTSSFAFNWPMGEGHYYFKYEGSDKAGNYMPIGAGIDDDWLYQLPPPHYDIPVILGWNLISFPVDAAGSPGTVLLDVDHDTYWNAVKWYDGASKTWKSYRSGSSVNTLTYVDSTMGLWVRITTLGDGYLGVAGAALGTSQINLYAGWNLVSYPSLVPSAVSDALWGTTTDIVERFDPVSPYVTPVDSNYIMGPGKGYWVHVQADAQWVVDW